MGIWMGRGACWRGVWREGRDANDDMTVRCSAAQRSADMAIQPNAAQPRPQSTTLSPRRHQQNGKPRPAMDNSISHDAARRRPDKVADNLPAASLAPPDLGRPRGKRKRRCMSCRVYLERRDMTQGREIRRLASARRPNRIELSFALRCEVQAAPQ